MTHPHARRRQRRAVGPVVDPAAGRPAHRRDRRRAARARRRRHRRGRRAARARPRPGRQPASPGSRTASLRTALDTVAGADGLIAVTPIFSASYSGLFKTFFDVLDRDALDRQARARRRDRPGRRGTRWRSSTRCGRCSPTCARSSRPTAVFAASEDWGSGGRRRPRPGRAHRPRRRRARRPRRAAGRRRLRPTRSPTPRRSRRCCAAPDRPRPVVSAARPNRPRRCSG